MSPLNLVRVSVSMERTQGRPEIAIALTDGLVALDRPDLAGAAILRSLAANFPENLMEHAAWPKVWLARIGPLCRACYRPGEVPQRPS